MLMQGRPNPLVEGKGPTVRCCTSFLGSNMPWGMSVQVRGNLQVSAAAGRDTLGRAVQGSGHLPHTGAAGRDRIFGEAACSSCPLSMQRSA